MYHGNLLMLKNNWSTINMWPSHKWLKLMGLKQTLVFSHCIVHSDLVSNAFYISVTDLGCSYSLWVYIFQYVNGVGSDLMYFQVSSPYSEYFMHFFSVTHTVDAHRHTWLILVSLKLATIVILCSAAIQCWACVCGYVRESWTSSHKNNNIRT